MKSSGASHRMSFFAGLWLLVFMIFGVTGLAENLGTAFTYQGRLTVDGAPANGTFDLRFALYAGSGGGTVLETVTVADQVVSGGLFTAVVDFGEQFTGEARYLEISVRPGSSTGTYTTMGPRQLLAPAPYALALPALRVEQNATSPNLIGGHFANYVASGKKGASISGGGTSADPQSVTGDYGAIGGGYGNIAGTRSVVGGGKSNSATGEDCTIAGGHDNQATSHFACVAGGANNRATKGGAFIGGGGDNLASEGDSVVAGGLMNVAQGSYSAIGGGVSNLVSGFASTIAGGAYNSATGHYSFAAGRRAKANHDGSFVLTDSTDADFASVRADALRARFNGGLTFQVNDGYWFRIWYASNRLLEASNGAHLTAGGAWTNSSRRALKENFAPVDGDAVLEQVANLPVQRWNYIAEGPEVKHLGPTVEDFQAAFGLGGGDGIATVDADGVSLAAIQALLARQERLLAQLQALEDRLESVEGENAAMARRLSGLEGGPERKTPR